MSDDFGERNVIEIEKPRQDGHSRFWASLMAHYDASRVDHLIKLHGVCDR